MDTKNKHLRNTETQMAIDLLDSVNKFIKAKKNRLAISKSILIKSRELSQASELLNHEPLLPSPIPKLDHPLARVVIDAEEARKSFGIE